MPHIAGVKLLSCRFPKWQGAPILDTYGGKAVLDYHGEPVFAELFTLRMLQRRSHWPRRLFLASSSGSRDAAVAAATQTAQTGHGVILPRK